MEKIIIIPATQNEYDDKIARSISEIVHDNNGFCCHTSTEKPSLHDLEARHRDRIEAALSEGGKVYAFNADKDLTSRGVTSLGSLCINGVRLVATLFG